MNASCTELITAFKDIVLAGAAIVTAIVAIKGLNTWNRQLRGTAGFEVARSLAKSAYRVRDALHTCRSPMIWANEFPPEYYENGLKRTAEQEANGYTFVYSKRWSPVWESIQDFDASTLEAEALWGSPIRQTTNLLRQVVREVNVAIDAHIANAASGGEHYSSDHDYGKETRTILFASSTDSANAINIRLAAAINAIDDQLRPHLQRS